MAKTRDASADPTAGALIRAMGHPIRPEILALARNGRTSAKTLSDTLGLPLPNISYHVRALMQVGLLRRAGRRDVRGAVQKFYVVDEDAILAACFVLEDTVRKIKGETDG